MCSSLGADIPSSGSNSKEVTAGNAGSVQQDESTQIVLQKKEYIGQVPMGTEGSNKFHDL